MSTTNILDLNNRIDALEKKHDAGGSASDTTYDNTASGLTADNVQGAIDELADDIDDLKAWTDPGTKSVSGNPITLTDGSARNAEGLVVTLEPIQSGSGTPSPDNVRPITGLTECVVDVKDEEETTQDTATIAFGQTVYGGSVDFKTGKVTVTHGYITLDGDARTNYGFKNYWESSSTYTKYVGRTSFNVGNRRAVNTSTDIVAISDKFNGTPFVYISTAGNMSAANDIDDAIYLDFGEASGLDTTEKQLAWLAQNPVHVCYELATPTELTLTPAELELLKGYNYISTNGTTIELTYQPYTLKEDILLTISQLYGSKIALIPTFEGILTGGDTGQVLTKTSDDNYDATWAALPATRTTKKQ